MKKMYGEKYRGLTQLSLCRCYLAFQQLIATDWKNKEYKEECDYIVGMILSEAKKTRAIWKIDELIRSLKSIEHDKCDTSSVRSLVEKLNRMRTSKIAGSANPFHLQGGEAGNGTGKSGRRT